MDNDPEKAEQSDVGMAEGTQATLPTDFVPEKHVELPLANYIEAKPVEPELEIEFQARVEAEVSISAKMTEENELPLDQFIGLHQPDPILRSTEEQADPVRPSSSASKPEMNARSEDSLHNQRTPPISAPRSKQASSVPSGTGANTEKPNNPSAQTPLGISEEKFTEMARGNTGRLTVDEFLKLYDKMAVNAREAHNGDTYNTYVGTSSTGTSSGQVNVGKKTTIGDRAIPTPPISPDLSGGATKEEGNRTDAFLNQLEVDIWESVETAYQWFYGELYEEEQVFAVTLAFFSGASQSDVQQAHKYIKDLLNVKESGYGAGIGGQRGLFSTPLPGLMNSTHSEFMTAYLLNNAGLVPVRGINFRDSRAVPIMLEMLAMYYNEFLMKLLVLLIAVAWDQDNSWGAYARKRSSTTLGLIARTDFDIIKTMVLDRWVRTGLIEPRLRYATATVLSTLYIPNGIYNRNIYALVRQWTGTKNNPSFVMTAIVVSSQLVAHNFKDYLEILKTIIMYDQTIYLEDLGAALISIYQDLREEISNAHKAVHFMQKLAEWSSSPHEGLHTGTLFLTLQLMAFTLSKDARVFPGEWELWNLPAKYKSANEQDTQQLRHYYRLAMGQIFARALSGPPLIVRLTNTILENLICAAADHPTYQIFVRYIFTDLCCSTLEREAARRVWDWLNIWGKAPRLIHYHPFINEVINYIRPRHPQEEG